MPESSVRTLLQRINSARGEVDYIQKDKSVSTGKSSYKAVTHDMVTAMTRKSLIANGIISWPVLVSSSMHAPSSEESKQWRYEATYDFIFANCDDANDKIVIRIEAHAMDNADKAPGKALSYAKKYAILKLLDIETGEDEESRVTDYDEEAAKYIAELKAAKDLTNLKSVFAVAYKAYSDRQYQDLVRDAYEEMKRTLANGTANA